MIIRHNDPYVAAISQKQDLTRQLYDYYYQRQMQNADRLLSTGIGATNRPGARYGGPEVNSD